MTKQERRARINELGKMLDETPMGSKWHELYEEYNELNFIDQQEYRQEQEPELIKYFEKHIKGKAWNEIDQMCLECYSDWHKDVYGFRPRATDICGG